jgi:hypothetical protein
MTTASNYLLLLENILSESTDTSISSRIEQAQLKLEEYTNVLNAMIACIHGYTQYNQFDSSMVTLFNKHKNSFIAMMGENRTKQLLDRIINPDLIDRANSQFDFTDTLSLIQSKLKTVKELQHKLENKPDNKEVQEEPMDRNLLKKFKIELQKYVKRSFTKDIESISKLNHNIISAALSSFTKQEQDSIKTLLQ